MIKILVFLACLFVLLNNACAFMVDGKIIMWENGEYVDGCVIEVYKNSDIIAQTISNDGKYKIELSEGKYTFIAVYINKDGKIYINKMSAYIGGNTTIDFLLIPYAYFSQMMSNISGLEIEPQNPEEKKITDNNKNTGNGNEELLFIIFVISLMVFFALIIPELFTISGKKIKIKTDPENKEIEGAVEDKTIKETQSKEIKITPGMENVMKGLTENERKIVKILLHHGIELRASEISRGAQISKSSLHFALNKLEEKKIVEIDKTFSSHTIRLTEWFKTIE